MIRWAKIPLITTSKDTAFTKVDSLKAAIVTAVSRPNIKGDSTEFITSNIRLQAYSNVEELLSRLPGLRIDAMVLSLTTARKLNTYKLTAKILLEVIRCL